MKNFYIYILVYNTIIIGAVLGKYIYKYDLSLIDTECGGSNEIDLCKYKVYCRGTECSYRTNSTDSETIRFDNIKGKTETLIPKYCTKESVDEGLCTTKKCSKDSNCLTHKCRSNVCVENESIDVEVCKLAYHNSLISLITKEKPFVHCGKDDGYVCENNGDCASNVCETKVCKTESDKSLKGIIRSNKIFFAIMLFSIVILIFIILKRIGVSLNPFSLIFRIFLCFTCCDS